MRSGCPARRPRQGLSGGGGEEYALTHRDSESAAPSTAAAQRAPAFAVQAAAAARAASARVLRVGGPAGTVLLGGPDVH